MDNKQYIYWGGNDVCDMCKGKIYEPLYDAKMSTGRWGALCSSCFDFYTFGKLGTGYGQKYMRTSNNRLIKVEG